MQGLYRGLHRQKGRTSGRIGNLLRPAPLLLVSVTFFVACILLWHPLPLALPISTHITALALGPLLYFPGLALLLWARLTLGSMYNASRTTGAQIYTEHQLITHGPFALVRHPMYLGYYLAIVGGLLLYHTWTLVLFLGILPVLSLRVRREEQVLVTSSVGSKPTASRDLGLKARTHNQAFRQEEPFTRRLCPSRASE